MPPRSSRSCRGRVFGGVTVAEIDDTAELPARVAYAAPTPATEPAAPTQAGPDGDHFLGELRLVRYRPLFSGPQVERIPELQFQRVAAELELSAADAERRSIGNGDMIDVRSNGTSVELRARVNRALVEGVARVSDEHAGDLHQMVEVVKR